MIDSSLPERYTLRQVASLLKVHIGTVYRWTLHGVRGRRLHSYLIGGRRFVDADELNQFLHSGKTQNAPMQPEPERDRKAQKRLESFGLSGKRKGNSRSWTSCNTLDETVFARKKKKDPNRNRIRLQRAKAAALIIFVSKWLELSILLMGNDDRKSITRMKFPECRQRNKNGS